MKVAEAIVRNEAGIHCRPSAVIIKAMAGYPGHIRIKTSAGEVDCRSIMGLLSLAMSRGTRITLFVEGPDEDTLCARLVELFETDFDFPPREGDAGGRCGPAGACIGRWSRSAGPGVVGTACRLDTLARLARASEPDCDLVEVRLDQLGRWGGGWIRRCCDLRAAGLPVLLTLRHAAEGGAWTGSNARRLSLYRRAQDFIDGVDVEIQQEAVRPAVAALNGTAVIGSFHDFAGAPADATLDVLIRRGVDAGAQIVKIACRIDDEDTLKRLEGLPSRHPDVNLAVVGMGAWGPASRVRLPRAGSCLTYGFLDQSVAPGQVSAADLRRALHPPPPATDP